MGTPWCIVSGTTSKKDDDVDNPTVGPDSPPIKVVTDGADSVVCVLGLDDVADRYRAGS